MNGMCQWSQIRTRDFRQYSTPVHLPTIPFCLQHILWFLLYETRWGCANLYILLWNEFKTSPEWIFYVCVSLPVNVCVACMLSDYTTALGEGKHWQLHFKSWAHVNEGLKKESKRVKAHLGLHSSILKCVLWCFYTVKYHVFQYSNIYWFTRTA